MFDRQNTLAKTDPALWAAIQNENKRQEDHIELIASENYTSPAVMEAQGSQLTNKYAEGYPGKRYVNLWMWQSNWRLIALKPSLVPKQQTCSLIVEPLLTRQFSWRS